MSTIMQHFYEEKINQIKILKTEKDEDQLFNNNLLKMVRFLCLDVYNNNIIMELFYEI